jgi:DNA-binding transcriptional ArsR family regulator
MELSDEARIFKALANEQRLKLFLFIQEQCRKGGDQACHEGLRKAFSLACEHLDVGRSTVSHHMRELVNAGLVTTERQGQAFICRVNPEAVDCARRIFA